MWWDTGESTLTSSCKIYFIVREFGPFNFSFVPNENLEIMMDLEIRQLEIKLTYITGSNIPILKKA